MDDIPRWVRNDITGGVDWTKAMVVAFWAIGFLVALGLIDLHGTPVEGLFHAPPEYEGCIFDPRLNDWRC